MEDTQVVDNELVTLRTKNQQLIDTLINVNKLMEKQSLLDRVSDWYDNNWYSGKITGVLKCILFTIMSMFIVITSARYSIHYFNNEIIRINVMVLYTIMYVYFEYNVKWKKKYKLL